MSCTSVQKATTPQCAQLGNRQCDSISVQVMAHYCADDMPLSCLWCMMLCSLDDMFQQACGSRLTFGQLLTSFKSRAASTCVKLYPVEIALPAGRATCTDIDRPGAPFISEDCRNNVPCMPAIYPWNYVPEQLKIE